MNRHRIAHQIKSQPSENISLSHKFTAFCRGMRHHLFYNLTQNTLSAWHFFPYGTQGNFKRKKIKTGKDFFNHVKNASRTNSNSSPFLWPRNEMNFAKKTPIWPKFLSIGSLLIPHKTQTQLNCAHF